MMFLQQGYIYGHDACLMTETFLSILQRDGNISSEDVPVRYNSNNEQNCSETYLNSMYVDTRGDHVIFCA